MFESTYVSGVAIPDFDRAISAALADSEFEGGGHTMVVAIENPEGQIYRVVECEGLGAYMHVTGVLEDLGLDDVLADEIEGADGLDSRFVVTEDTRAAADQ